jgi:hypothetical protein
MKSEKKEKLERRKNSHEYGNIVERTFAKDRLEYLRRMTFIPFVKSVQEEPIVAEVKLDHVPVKSMKTSDFYRNLVTNEQSEPRLPTVGEPKGDIIGLFDEWKPFAPKNQFGITESNRGYQMMKSSGWNATGLGPCENGRLFPIPTAIKNDRKGIGNAQNSKKITHLEVPKKVEPKRQRNWIESEDRKMKLIKTKIRDEIYGEVIDEISTSYAGMKQ